MRRARLRLQLRPWERGLLVLLQVVPPGLGAVVAGWRNPHTRLLARGGAQLVLFVFGAYPLVLPGAVGLAWAVWDAVRIAQAALVPLPPPAADG